MNRATKGIEAPLASSTASRLSDPNGNKLRPEDRAVHDWYRFILSFPPHLVRDYIKEFRLSSKSCVLDPFCGTGTTLVESKKQGLPSVGIEANAMAFFASEVKTNWRVDIERLLAHSRSIAKQAEKLLVEQGVGEFDSLPLFGNGGRAELSLQRLEPEAQKLLLRDSISELPLHKCLTLLRLLEDEADESVIGHQRLALAKTLVFTASNLHFDPDPVYRTPRL